uniref:C-type lectin domain-containing protein n=1 Tax=Xiphophorus maculatus TaxID=8083 RepID=A0A3B5Q6R5_XIPMA
YIIVDELKTWTEAQRYCRENHKDLATITNMEDVRMLNDLATGRTSMSWKMTRAWIGLHEDVNSWRWSMSDQYQNQFRNWAAGQPNNKFDAVIQRGAQRCSPSRHCHVCSKTKTLQPTLRNFLPYFHIFSSWSLTAICPF